MDSYQPPFTITNTMLLHVASISEKIGKMGFDSIPEKRIHLRRSNRIRSIHSSLKIEANSLTLHQVRDVIEGHAVLGKQTDIVEVQNAYLAYHRLSLIDPFSLMQLKEIHHILTKGLLSEAGYFRQGEEGVFDGDICIFMAPPAKQVGNLMIDLFAWMSANKQEVHPLIMSCVFHYEFVFIHPFSDGNGRMARLWQTALLMKWKPMFEYIPLESQIEKFQSEYYEAIAQCHIEGSSNTFTEFMLMQIDNVLDDLIQQLHVEKEQMSEYTKKMLKVMEDEIPYTTNVIMEKLSLKSKETFRKNYMQPALEIGIVEMTIPDKPNSKNQRYKKKSENI